MRASQVQVGTLSRGLNVAREIQTHRNGLAPVSACRRTMRQAFGQKSTLIMRSVASPPDLNLLHAPPLSAADGISGITGRPLFSTPAGPYVVVLFYGQSQTVNIVGGPGFVPYTPASTGNLNLNFLDGGLYFGRTDDGVRSAVRQQLDQARGQDYRDRDIRERCHRPVRHRQARSHRNGRLVETSTGASLLRAIGRLS